VALKRLPVDLAELAAALDQPRNGPVRAFFDRQSGDVEHVPRAATVEGVYDDIFAAPDRWVEIFPLPRPVRDGLRRRFATDVDDAQIRLRLADALNAERSGPAFSALLREVPRLQDAWLAFRARELDSLVRAWLSAIQVEPLEPGPHRPV
jgi:hypothetical protein